MNTFKGYVNYGCLAAEKIPVFTAGNPNSTATASEAVTYTIPDGWELHKNDMDNDIVTAPWGWTYDPNELLSGKDNPCFAGIDKDGKGFRIDLQWSVD